MTVQISGRNLLTGDRVKDAEEVGVVHAPFFILDLASSPIHGAATDSHPNFIECYQALAFFQEDKGLQNRFLVFWSCGHISCLWGTVLLVLQAHPNLEPALPHWHQHFLHEFRRDLRGARVRLPCCTGSIPKSQTWAQPFPEGVWIIS